METYRKYFDIDPDFFPAVNNDVIKKEPNLWKKYFPHETFVKLLKQTLSVLERKQKLNIWVEGAYGTGKSHAVLTLKHLLDASEEDTDEYFKQFKLDDDLRLKFVSAKKQGKIITVHRYGSSSIHSDNDLFLAMQESIEEALNEAGINNAGPNALKEGIIKYLSDEENKQSVEVYVKGSYKELFGGQSVEDIVQHLKDYSGEALQSLMNNIFKLANEKNIKTFTLDDSTMVEWITEVLKANSLKAIVFIWDEFTEYFSNNAHRLTGFQHILDMSQTEPFCFIPVTHRSDAGMDDSDQDKKKILGRFISPTCIIELPENMAFQLIGAAMQVTDDEVVRADWEEIKNDIELRTNGSRKRIMQYAKIDDNELRKILPIHPYAACLLKHISASFASNQRSMFDFIKNGGNDDNHGFQWYIDKFGPLEENPLLTIDLLWGFFYDKGKNDLSQPIRQILDRFGNLSKQLDDDEKKVLKTILLFQAISQSSGDSIDIFLPNEKNLNYAFEGTDLENAQSVRCAEKLIRDKVIYKKPQKDGSFLYSVLTGDMDADQISKNKGEFEKRTTSNLIQDGQLNESVDIPQDLKLRFKLAYAGVTDIDQIARKYINEANDNNLYFYAVVCLSKTVSESIAMAKKITQIRSQYPDSEVVFIDCGKTPLGEEEFATWVDNMATSSYYTGKDNAQAMQYNSYAKQILSKWGTKIAQGQFTLYTKEQPSGDTVHSIDELGNELHLIDRKRFPLSLECNYKSINSWWTTNSLQVGVECGVMRSVKGTYNNNNANLKKSLDFAWDGTSEYWKDHPVEPISRIKSALEDFMQNTLKNDGRISIVTIYDFLSSRDYGFLPCNMTAFFMGFLLKEYVDDKYSWSDTISSDSMSLQKMKEMIEEVIKNQITPNPRYRAKYIVTMTPEEKAFIEGTAEAFDISKTNCSSVESARDRIRNKMKDNLYFPIWTLVEILDTLPITVSRDFIEDLITYYQDLANNTTGKSDNDIANEIGKTYLGNKSAASDLHNILTPDNCKKGMLKYLDCYQDGVLPKLAQQLGDGGQYINELKKKFDAGEANWVWKKQTADQQIDVVILEYRITVATSQIIGSVTSFKSAIIAWNDKTSNIKISLETAKNYVGGILPLLSALKDIKHQGTLPENKKEQFLDILNNYGKEFNIFYTNQLDLFKQSCSFYLQDLSDSDSEKVFKKLPSGGLVLDNATYSKMVEEIVTDYKKELSSSQLKNLWRQRTGSESPRKWSEQYKQPILAMIPDSEQSECRVVFGILNNPNPSDKDITKALNYLNQFTYWDVLSDSTKRDAVFKDVILKERAVMIANLDEIRNYLVNHVTEASYYWLGNSQVDKAINDYAQAQYNNDGYKKAMEKIDSMGAEFVKAYLKELIKNNMNVGIQIIKNN